VPEGVEPFYGGFAYADSSGRRLLAVSELSDPAAVLTAICQSGGRLAVRFDRHQPRGENDSGRQTSRNFDNDEGDLFRVVDGDAGRDETCLLIGPALFALASPTIPRGALDTRCDPADSTRITEVKQRLVTSCSRVWIVDDTTRVVAAVFELRGDSALASLALIDPIQVALLDFPGHHDPDAGTWRVGDGGAFHAEHINILFVTVGPTDRAIALAWGAGEGESSVLAVAVEGATTLEEGVRGYRYWMAH
jgi:hypothetical protein